MDNIGNALFFIDASLSVRKLQIFYREEKSINIWNVIFRVANFQHNEIIWIYKLLDSFVIYGEEGIHF